MSILAFEKLGKHYTINLASQGHDTLCDQLSYGFQSLIAMNTCFGSSIGANPKCASTSRVVTEVGIMTVSQNLIYLLILSLGGRLAVSRTQSSTTIR